MRLSVASLSEKGKRQKNEDYLGFVGTDIFGCFVLADGAGGASGGERASSIVVKKLLYYFNDNPDGLVGSVDWVIGTAQKGLTEGRRQYPENADMNTTLTTLMVDVRTGVARWAHLGDSRIYLFRGGRACGLTQDHSIARALVSAGYAYEAHGDCAGMNVLYASVGCSDLPLDAVCNDPLFIQAGDVFLLCTDGFWSALDVGEMESSLADSEAPEVWLEKLDKVIKNMDKPDQDNYSAMAVWVGEPIPRTRVVSTVDSSERA
jgi:PPM family protein phosphatase